jgi:hypothetical protein
MDSAMNVFNVNGRSYKSSCDRSFVCPGSVLILTAADANSRTPSQGKSNVLRLGTWKHGDNVRGAAF